MVLLSGALLLFEPVEEPLSFVDFVPVESVLVPLAVDAPVGEPLPTPLAGELELLPTLLFEFVAPLPVDGPAFAELELPVLLVAPLLLAGVVTVVEPVPVEEGEVVAALFSELDVVVPVPVVVPAPGPTLAPLADPFVAVPVPALEFVPPPVPAVVVFDSELAPADPLLFVLLAAVPVPADELELVPTLVAELEEPALLLVARPVPEPALTPLVEPVVEFPVAALVLVPGFKVELVFPGSVVWVGFELEPESEIVEPFVADPLVATGVDAESPLLEDVIGATTGGAAVVPFPDVVAVEDDPESPELVAEVDWLPLPALPDETAEAAGLPDPGVANRFVPGLMMPDPQPVIAASITGATREKGETEIFRMGPLIARVDSCVSVG